LSSANSIDSLFIELHQVESTNNYAMGLIHAGMAQQGTAVFAHEQTKGKGQRNKQWISAPGKNIILSIIIQPFGLKIKQQFLLSMNVANVVQKFFNNYTKKNTKIKWPNDIYWCDRKAGGILIENVLQGKVWKYAVIGIGLNINQVDFGNNKKAISLSQITGDGYDTMAMAKELAGVVHVSCKQLTSDSKEIAKRYHKHLYKSNEKVQLKVKNKTFEGIIKGVTEDGLLIVSSPENDEHYRAGEVEWMES